MACSKVSPPTTYKPYRLITASTLLPGFNPGSEG